MPRNEPVAGVGRTRKLASDRCQGGPSRQEVHQRCDGVATRMDMTVLGDEVPRSRLTFDRHPTEHRDRVGIVEGEEAQPAAPVPRGDQASSASAEAAPSVVQQRRSGHAGSVPGVDV